MQITDRTKNEWKYKIDLTDTSVFDEIEKERNTSFPEDLKQFIIETNAATPTKYHFMLDNSEKVLGAVLSFNKNETEADSIETAFAGVQDETLIPFAIDPFGNYICYCMDDNTVGVWEHETNAFVSTKKGLSKFVDDLY